MKKRWLGVGAIAIGCLALIWWLGRKNQPEVDFAPDPRLTYSTRFRNTRPDVQFVGDDACTGCHRNHVTNYHKHPMGRSLLPLPQAEPIETYDAAAANPFSAIGFQYQVKREGDREWHTETRLQANGKPLAESTYEINYVMGSGSQGRGYIIERDGFLLQSPIAWFRRNRQWDLAPGFANAPTHLHFERKVDSRCLFCHVNSAEPVPNTLNRFVPPTFRAGYSIGCERCHGPGELHVRYRKEHEEAVDVDETIVNPRHLEPALREAICQQCHLEPDFGAMILRRGRKPFDFRPGLPLHLFWSLFVNGSNQAEHRFVSQVDQMYASRCFEASQGKLGCISCHDPHRLIPDGEKITFYRRRCLECHEQHTCSLPLAERQLRSPEDSCIQCHMPRRDSKDINHTWLSDHRIPKLPHQETHAKRDALSSMGDVPLVLFHQKLVEPAHQPEVNRDLAIALVEIARGLNWRDNLQSQVAQSLSRRALTIAEPGIVTWPKDLRAREAKAIALWAVGRTEDAFNQLEEIIAMAPDREFALFHAGRLGIELNRNEAALEYLKRAAAVNPWDANYQIELARCLSICDHWSEAAAASRRAVELDPFQPEAHKYMVAALLQTGDKAGAQREFDILMALNPPDQEALRKWYAEQSR